MRVRTLLPALRLLARRFDHDRLAQTAGSLTFTSLISLVPLLAVGLAVFTAFPAFHALQTHLQQQFAKALLPPDIGGTVMRYLNEFAAKAKSLGVMGVIGLAITANSLMLTVDRALNAIWRTARPRPLAQRIIVYWTAITLGPLALGTGLAASAALLASHRGWMHQLHGLVEWVLTLLSWALTSGALAALYRFVPNTEVRWRDALAGGVFGAVCFDLAGRGFAWYVASMPTLTAVYGTFATLPIFLLWLYWSWVVLLLGAMLAAVLPLLRIGARPVDRYAGAPFVFALELLRLLARSRRAPDCGLETLDLARGLRCDPLELQPALDALEALGWIGCVRPRGRAARWVILVDPATTAVEPLVDALVLDLPRATPPVRAMIGPAQRALTIQQLWAEPL